MTRVAYYTEQRITNFTTAQQCQESFVAESYNVIGLGLLDFEQQV